MTDDKIREVFLAHGFTIKEGQTDLKPYVYAAARALLAAAAPMPAFASHVGRRKWGDLQSDGYRMQRIHFARSVDGHERRGTIDPWGKVLWEPDGVPVVAPTDEEIAAWADNFILAQAFNRPIAVQIAIEAAKWVRSRTPGVTAPPDKT